MATATITLRPTAAGDEENITNATSGAGLHWQDVDEVTPDDGDAVWINASQVNYLRDLYALTNIGAATGTISNITIYVRAICPDGDPTAASVKICLKTGGTAYESAEKTITGSLAYYSNAWTTNPKTSVAWTWSDIGSLQIGVSLKQSLIDAVGYETYCSQVYVIVTYTLPAKVTFHCKIAFANDVMDETPTWNNVSTHLMAFSTRRGRQHELDRFECGTATITLNNASGVYWPGKTGGYYPNVKNRKRVQIYMTYNAVDYPLYTGFVESWTPRWLKYPNTAPVMILECADLIKIMAKLRLNDGTGYSEELSGTRIDNVLVDVGWPASLANTDAGLETIIASGAQVNVVAQSHIYDVVDAELGQLYIAADGDVNFEDRSHRSESPHTAALATFGDAGNDWIMPYQIFQPALDDILLINEARLTRSGGTEQVITNAASVTDFGLSDLVKSGLLIINDVVAKAQAALLVARYKDSDMRAKVLTVIAARQPALLYPKVGSYEISDRIKLVIGDAYIDDDYFIEGIQHDYDAKKGILTTRYMLSDATRYLTADEAIEETLRPNSTVTSTNLTIVGGSATVHEALSDNSDTTSVKNTNEALDAIAVCGLPDASFPHGIINSVKVYWRISGNASSQNDLSIVTGGNQYDGFTNYIATSIETKSYTWSTNPGTTDPWTWSEINALQVRWQADGITAAAYCYDIWVVVNFTPDWTD